VLPSVDKLELARTQLAKVQVAAVDPVDWSDLSLYSFYALENAVAAAADAAGVSWKQTHPSKIDASVELNSHYGLPDIADLLRDLNAIRKSSAYGEYLTAHRWDAEDIASQVEAYIDAVDTFVLDQEEEEEEEEEEEGEGEREGEGEGEGEEESEDPEDSV
jgi:hypothetical protein